MVTYRKIGRGDLAPIPLSTLACHDRGARDLGLGFSDLNVLDLDR
jgi:hypothetical protein